jgi:hypothetical protein
VRRLGTNAVGNAIGYAMHYSRSADAVIRVYAPEGSRTVGVWEVGIALGKRIVSRCPDASMLTVPNPGARNERPAHCDGGIHYIWPFKFGAKLTLVIVLAIAAHIPRKQNKAAKQDY